jgi:hypothetical protein
MSLQIGDGDKESAARSVFFDEPEINRPEDDANDPDDTQIDSFALDNGAAGSWKLAGCGFVACNRAERRPVQQ